MKHMIWSSEFNIEDWEDFFEEMYPELTDEDEKWAIANEENGRNLDDERANLCYHEHFIGIADVGRWNGRYVGYKVFSNLRDILYSECDQAEWYVEGNTLKGKMVHHDGTNYVKYYRFMKRLPGADDFLGDLLEGKKISKSRFYKYCKSAGKIVKDIYGWR